MKKKNKFSVTANSLLRRQTAVRHQEIKPMELAAYENGVKGIDDRLQAFAQLTINVGMQNLPS